MLPRILLTAGEPAGIGPDIVGMIAQQNWSAEIVAVGDPGLFHARAKLLGLPLTLEEWSHHHEARPSKPGYLKVIPIKLHTASVPSELNIKNASYVLETLEIAAKLCQQGKANTLVTGPIHKAHLNQAGYHFSGHTEYLATLADIEQTLMLFVAEQLRVALVTTHLPLTQVANAITQEKIIAKATLLANELKHRFGISEPSIAVCGLNPHAGENGFLGREEIDVIAPALQTLQAKGIHVTGPHSADSVFVMEKKADAILAMYHDQALPVVKSLSFHQAVNVTLGLPYLRTSVDHGTALSLAGTGKADARSMAAAIQLAINLTI